MNSKCTVCKKAFKADQIVYRPKDRVDVTACSPACCKKYDDKRHQKEAFPVWIKYRYTAKKFSSSGCHIDKTTIAMKDSPPVVTVGVRLPGKVSVDELKGFSGEDVTILITRNKFEVIREPAKKKVAKTTLAKKTTKPPKTDSKK